jgi:NRAMP (natural resistance-associated macrophage protein)-like metal ion transporter
VCGTLLTMHDGPRAPAPTRTGGRRFVHDQRRHRLRGHGYFSRLGPGLVTGAADDDPSGIGTYSQVGAAFGYSLVWSVLLVAPMAVAVQEATARLGLVTGRGLAALLRERFPKPVLAIALVLTVAANTFNIGADVAAMAAAVRLVVDLPVEILAVALTAVMLVLELTMPYHRYARILRWLALSLFSYVVALALVDVDWNAVLDAIVRPSLHLGAAELGALVAVFGTTVSPYLFFWQAGEEVEEEKERGEAGSSGPSAVQREHLTAMRVDVIGGMVSAVVIAFVIIVVAAATLHPASITTVATSDQAARALRPLAGDLAGLLFAVGIVGVGLLAVPVLAGSTAYTLSEAFAWNEGFSGQLREDTGFYSVLVLTMLGGVVMGLVGIDPIRGLYYAAILNGLAAPPLIVLMLLLARDRKVCGRHVSGWLSTAVLLATIAASVAVGALFLLSR